MMNVDIILDEFAKAIDDPEAFRTELRQAESRLTLAQRRMMVRLRFAALPAAAETGENLFFMSGLFKSGTTWLGMLLNAHPGLCCPAQEMHSFSAQVTDLYLDKPIEALPPSEAKVWGENILDAKRAALFWQIVALCDKPSAKLLGGRGPIANLRQLIRAFPGIRIPVIMRDGRDVAVSAAFFHQKYYGQSYERFFEDPEKTRINADYAAGWGWQFRHFYSGALQVAKEFPKNIVVVRYEDLLAEPVEWMRKIYGFLGVSIDPPLVRHCVEMCSFETLTGGRKRGEADPGSFFRKGVAGDWREYFTPLAIRKFNETAGDFLLETGYKLASE
jgi:hypothetical protein